MYHSRRDFLKKATATGAAILAAPAVFGTGAFSKRQKAFTATAPFKLKYAPGFGMFREHAGNDIIDNIKFCHDMGFRAMFDNGLMGRPIEDQVKIANEIHRLGMELGPFVLSPRET
jgi:hydroxypyruvate isomerase